MRFLILPPADSIQTHQLDVLVQPPKFKNQKYAGPNMLHTSPECIGQGVVRGAHTSLQHECGRSLADAFLYSANLGADELKAVN